MMDFDAKFDELNKKAHRVSVLSTIYDSIKDKMKWEAMDYHSPDDEHEEVWFTEPDPENSWDYDNKVIAHDTYLEVLEMIEKLANK